MDEADVLGDRIAIMADGRLRTIGSSFFLKKKFGTGYKLICVKEPSCNADLILKVLTEYAPDAKMESDAQTEAVFVIGEHHLPIFQNIFKRLEDDAQRLKISSFGCNLSTLEEVFLKLGTESYDVTSVENPQDQEPTNSSTVSLNHLMLSKRVDGNSLIVYQIQAMILKKFHYMRRNYRSAFFMTLFSAWIIVVLMSAPTVHFNSVPSLDITLASYDDTITTIEHYDDVDSLTKKYQSLFLKKDETVMAHKDMQTYILEKSYDSLPTVNRKYLIGATLKPNKSVAWFNGQPFHTMPLTLNTLNRALLKNFAGDDYDISLTNKPFVWIGSDSDDIVKMSEGIAQMVVPLLIFYILLIHWPSIFIGFYIKERESRAKLLQLISGLNRFVYWGTSFLFDYAIFFVVIVLLVGGIGAYQRQHLSTASELGTILVIFMFYGFATLPLIYAFSYMFSKHSTGESMVSVGGLLRKLKLSELELSILKIPYVFSCYSFWCLRHFEVSASKGNLESIIAYRLLDWPDAWTIFAFRCIDHVWNFNFRPGR